jgi:hypothetical protein
VQQLAQVGRPWWHWYGHYHERMVEQIGSTCYVLLGVLEPAEVPPVR